MRAILFVALCCGMVWLPIADAQTLQYGDYGVNASLYMAYHFDAPSGPQNTPVLHFGLQMDSNGQHRDRKMTEDHLLQWQFDRRGFDYLSVAGAPVISRALVLRADDGGTFHYLKNHLGEIAIIASGVIVAGAIGFAIVNKNSRNSNDINDPPGANTINCNGPNRPPACVGP